MNYGHHPCLPAVIITYVARVKNIVFNSGKQTLNVSVY